MAQIVLDIPNAQLDRVVDAMCRAGGYSGSPGDVPARRVFAKRMIIDYIRATVGRVEQAEAMAAAMAATPTSDLVVVT